MRKSTLVPVRIKGKGKSVIGDEENAVSNYGSGYTRAIVYATAESVLDCSVISESDRRVLAHCIDDSLLEFDSYREEYESDLGRAAYQIALEEGVEAYEELKDEITKNVYLYAAVYKIPVRQAAEELDYTASIYIETESGLAEFSGGYTNPDPVSVTIEVDGEERSRDIRTFTPHPDWVMEHWDDLTRRRNAVNGIDQDSIDRLEEMALDEQGSYVRDTVISGSKTDLTAHYVRETESSPVEDEPDRLRYYCGRTTRDSKNTLRLDADTRDVEINVCGNCERSVSE